ncbi:hypothetical protein SBA5_400016 [Candidatus Sulfotelmatomonas gaucii]|uniref:Uncharacterized protein n=1 Tax=Candidatus Sulfuritelmatomonas gaucii TaxID=2043161 RepID=A0A2N9LKN1_9BACT|nr:hypothetical protein SBA5_400016 [Candidatus Sulfotelmatomonas gaucii]
MPDFSSVSTVFSLGEDADRGYYRPDGRNWSCMEFLGIYRPVFILSLLRFLLFQPL